MKRKIAFSMNITNILNEDGSHEEFYLIQSSDSDGGTGIGVSSSSDLIALRDFLDAQIPKIVSSQKAFQHEEK